MRWLLLFGFFNTITFTITAQPKKVVRTGENFILLNGDRFHNEKIKLEPNNTGYDNLWFNNGKQKFTDIDLVGKFDGRSVDFQLRFPGQTGTFIIEDNKAATGSQRNDLDCYLIMSDKDTYGDGLKAQTGSVKVEITKYDAVGGLIEGTFTGTLDNGKRSDNIITVSGKFSVVRDKDKTRF